MILVDREGGFEAWTASNTSQRIAPWSVAAHKTQKLVSVFRFHYPTLLAKFDLVLGAEGGTIDNQRSRWHLWPPLQETSETSPLSRQPAGDLAFHVCYQSVRHQHLNLEIKARLETARLSTGTCETTATSTLRRFTSKATASLY